MIIRVLTTALLIALLCALSGGQALAQGDSQPPPTDLWNEYPLEEDSAAPSSPSQRQQRESGESAPAPATSGDEADESAGFDVPNLMLPAALAALLLALAAGLYARRLALRRSREKRLGERLSAPGGHDVSFRPMLSLQPDPPGREEPQPDIQAEAPLREPTRKPSDSQRAALSPVHFGEADQQVVVGNGQPVVEGNGQPSPAAGTSPDPEPEDREQPDEQIAASSAAAENAGEPVPPAGEQADGDLMPAMSPEPAQDASGEALGGRAIGYSSVERGAGPQGESSAQAEAIEAACERLGLEFLELVHDTEPKSGSDLKRPGLMYALERISLGDASCMVVPSLDRLSRSAADLGSLMEWFGDKGVRLVALDIGLDTASSDGQMAARALATVGGLERQRLGERTRKGLEAARTKRRSSGRPAVSDRPALKERIAGMRADGMTLQAIADTLNAEGVPTLRGGSQWRPSSVQAAAGYKRPNRKNELNGLPGAGRSEGAEVASDEATESD